MRATAAVAGLIAFAVVVGGCRSERPRWLKQRLARVPDGVLSSQIGVSKDGEHLAYSEKLASGQRIVVDGKPGPSMFGCDWPVFSPVTNRVFHWMLAPGEGPNRIGITADGAQVPSLYAEQGSFVFSRDGKRWAAIGGQAEQGPTVLVVDGKEVGRYKDATPPAFSDDGAHVAWLVQRDDDRIALMVDGHEQRVFATPEGHVSPPVKAKPVGPNLTPQYLVRYLSDGSLIVVAQDADGWAVYRDDVRLGSYRHNVWLARSSPVAVAFGPEFRAEASFTPTLLGTADAAPVAAWWERAAGEFDRWRVVRNGEPAGDDICDQFWKAQPVILSNDGRHTAYYCFKLVPGTTGEGDVVADGKHYGPFRHAFGLVFSDDGTRFAYGGWSGELNRGWTLYREEKPLAGPFDSIWRPRFDPKGTHLAWEAQLDRSNILGVDGRTLASFGEVLWGPEFTVPGYVTWVIRNGRNGRNIRRLSARLD